MYELALFAGAGGGLLASKWLLGWRTVCYVEIDGYCVEVLRARIGEGLLDDAPIWGDARTFDGRSWRGCVDIVTAGFPCQPFSRAGKRLAERDKRNLWPDTARIIDEIRPQYIFLENVPGLRCPTQRDGEIIPSYFGRILGDLAESGYDARWDCVPAAAIGANHQRDRLWVVANANGGGFQEYAEFDSLSQSDSSDGNTRGGYAGGCGDEMGDADCARLAQWEAESLVSNLGSIERSDWWKIEPKLGRVADGVAYRVDRIRAIGNGQVPAVVAAVWRLLGG